MENEPIEVPSIVEAQSVDDGPSLCPPPNTDQTILDPPPNHFGDYVQTNSYDIQEHSDEPIKSEEDETEEGLGVFEPIINETPTAPDSSMRGINDDQNPSSVPVSPAFTSPRLRMELEKSPELPTSMALEDPATNLGVMHASNEENCHDAIGTYAGCTEELGFQETNDVMDTDPKEERFEQPILPEEVPAVAEPGMDSQSTAMDISTTGPAETELVTANIEGADGPKPMIEHNDQLFSNSWMPGRGSLPPPGKPTSTSIAVDDDNLPRKKRSASVDLSLRMTTTLSSNEFKRLKLVTPNLDSEKKSPGLNAIDQAAGQSSETVAIRENIEVIDLEIFEQDRNDRLAREAREKQTEEEEQAARLIQEDEEMRQQELQMYTNNFLNSFQSGGISTDETVNPQEARYAAVTSEGLAAVLRFVHQVQKESKEDVAMLRVDNDVLRGELQKSKETEARLAEEIKELTDSRSQKMWKTKMKTEREKMEGDLSRVEKKLDLLRAPDVTLEKMHTKIDGFDKHMSKKLAVFDKQFANMMTEAEKFKGACEAEKRLLNTARKELTKDFRTRKDEIERIDGEIQNVESSLEELNNRVRDVEASSDQDQHMPRNTITALELSQVLDDISQLREEVEGKDERLDTMQNDIQVFRSHVNEHLFDKDCLYTQAELNRIFFVGISDLTYHISGLRKQLVASVVEMRNIIALGKNGCVSQQRHAISLNPQLLATNNDSPPDTPSDEKAATSANSEAIHNLNSHQNHNDNGEVDLHADMDGLHEQVQAQSTPIAELQNQQPTESNTDIETRISVLIDPVRNDIDGLIKDLRLLAHKVKTMQTELGEADQDLDARLASERIERIQAELKESMTRATATAVCGRYLSGMMTFARNIGHKSMIELGSLARKEDKHCSRVSQIMNYWNFQIAQSLNDKTGEKAHELMAMVNKMRRGEKIPEDLERYYIDQEEDEALLGTLRKNLRKVLDEEGIWTAKSSIDLTAESDTE
ncbi:hypothetical protein BLS_002370 [Venturia inaequalis]|uniref:Uncharacterized protein n=1 Tax=Venturia inaequalis TaxID=5025 RepID=A0A8H3YW42_VENIN|nr:hypothetical protein BLS_002370 [Venturia inaequalis]